MERISLPLIYRVGGALTALLALRQDDNSRWDVSGRTQKARTQLSLTLDAYPNLRLCRPAITELFRYIDELKPQTVANNWRMGDPGIIPVQGGGFWPNEGAPMAMETPPTNSRGRFAEFVPLIEAMDIRQVLLSARKVETILLAELDAMTTYHASQKAIYETVDLVERGEHVLSVTAQRRLGEAILAEIRSSGRCLAFDNGTAAAFHSLRALELAMHAYYTVHVPSSQSTRLANWGEYLAKFKLLNNKPTERIVALIQAVKDHDRNPLMHPELTLSDDQALTVFEVCKAAILAIADELPDPSG